MPQYNATQNSFYNTKNNPESNYPPQNQNSKLSFNDQKLWKQSQISQNYVTPRISFSKQKRFKLHSIYWPMNENPISRINRQRSGIQMIAKKISRDIDEQEKNQIRTRAQTTSTNRAEKIKSSFITNSKQKLQQQKSDYKNFILDQKNQEIVRRLSITSPIQQSLLRDRHGFRSNRFSNQDQHLYQVVHDQMQTMAHTNGFQSSNGFKCSSKRKNLNLPYNYYPGPGTYQIKRYLQELDWVQNKEHIHKEHINKQQHTHKQLPTHKLIQIINDNKSINK